MRFAPTCEKYFSPPLSLTALQKYGNIKADTGGGVLPMAVSEKYF